MAWVDLPLDIIEKIIDHAVKGEEKEVESEENWFAMRVYHYGCVHPSWKEAIRLSRTIFKVNWMDRSQVASKTVYVDNGTIDLPRAFIEDGYLQAVQSLVLRFHRDGDLKFIFDSLQTRNSIVRIELGVQSNATTTYSITENLQLMSVRRQLSEKTGRQLIDLVTRLTKMIGFTIYIRVDTQAEAEWLWQLMRVVVHSNSHPKGINFEILHSGRAAIVPIDWSFTDDDERLDVGFIEKLFCTSAPVGFFANLADIDKLQVKLDTEFWHSESKVFLADTKANHLEIICTLDQDTYDQDNYWPLLNHLRSVWFPSTSFNVETVVCLIDGDADHVQKSPIFENDAEVWQKIKDWFLPIVDNYRVRIDF